MVGDHGGLPDQCRDVLLRPLMQDIFDKAETSSWKTPSFALPLMERLRADRPKFGTSVLCLSPMHELAWQMENFVN